MLFDCASRNLKTACAPAGVLVVVADGTRCRLLVPDMLGERGDLAQLVVGEEIRAVRLAEVEGDLQRVIGIDRGAQDVVGVLAGRVAGPVLLVGSHEVLPELDVTRGDLCAVRPLPAFQGDRHRLAVRGIHGWIREAEAVVQQHLPVLTEPVQRAVHEELELAQVRDAEILQARERQDVVRLRSRAFSERRSRLRDLRTRRSVAGAPARGNDEHRTEFRATRRHFSVAMRVSTSYTPPQRVRTVHPHADDTERPSTSIRSCRKFIPTGDELLRAKAQNGIAPFARSGHCGRDCAAGACSDDARSSDGAGRCAVRQSLKNHPRG